MSKLPSTRILIAIGLIVLFLFALVAILFITDLSFSVWEHLQQKPAWLIWIYVGVIVLVSFVFGRIAWRLLMPRKKAAHKLTKGVFKGKEGVHSLEAVEQQLDSLSAKLEKHGFERHGFDKLDGQQTGETSTTEVKFDQEAQELISHAKEIDLIKQELQAFADRKHQHQLYIALFGDISSGKSSLIKALVDAPVKQQKKLNSDQEAENSINSEKILVGVTGGTTRLIKHYEWWDNNWNQYFLTDMPGLNEQFSTLDQLAIEEVQRAHVAIYLCDGDLTASQYEELQTVLGTGKPSIIALNKSDLYSQHELNLIIDKLQQHVDNIAENIPVVTITAGGEREYIRQTPDGHEERVIRPIPVDVSALQKALAKLMKQHSKDVFEQLREESVAQMMTHRLDDLDARFRRSQSEHLVKIYTKRAVVAALATISPGTDILVQGYLGIQLIKELCQLYDVPATDIGVNKLLGLIQGRMKKTLALLLAIIGNGFKAFPGIGTVTGGLIHAVAYGMIFDTLGHSVARTLEVTGQLSPTLVNDLYQERLGENIESRTKDIIKMVLKLRKEN
jgi:GTP-binding protein EngB required for normal cell division